MVLNEYAASRYASDHPFASEQMAQSDDNATLIRTAGGKLVTLDFATNTPNPPFLCRLQGTKGVDFGDRHTPRAIP